jgi:hypothetical protein
MNEEIIILGYENDVKFSRRASRKLKGIQKRRNELKYFR